MQVRPHTRTHPGLGDTKNRSTPTVLHTLEAARVGAVAVCAAWAHNLVVDADGGLWTWGHGGSGRLGHGSCLDIWTPRRVDALLCARVRVVDASASFEHSGACCNDGSVWMWGLGEHGQLGLGDTATRATPVAVQALRAARVRVVALACGGAHSAAVCDQGWLYTWGRGDWGQLGHGNRAGRLFGKAVRHLGHARVRSVVCGWGCTVALSDGTKSNSDGEPPDLGDMTDGVLSHPPLSSHQMRAELGAPGGAPCVTPASRGGSASSTSPHQVRADWRRQHQRARTEHPEGSDGVSGGRGGDPFAPFLDR